MKKAIAILLAAAICLSVCACGKAEPVPTASPQPELSEEMKNQLKEEIRQELLEEMAETPAPEPAEEPKEPEVKAEDFGIIRPELKEFLDAYEAFMDEYVIFMNEYMNADSSDMIGLFSRYSEFMTKYLDFEQKLEAFDTDSMNNAELAYYLEVTTRVEQKLITAIG